MFKVKSKYAIIALTIFLSGCSSNLPANITPSKTRAVTSLNIATPDTQNLDIINREIDYATGTKNSLNNYNVKFYVDGPQAYPVLEDMIKNARESIYIEVFKFYNDDTGKRIVNELIAKAKQGLDVKVLYNYLGNNDVAHLNYLAKNGVTVETYNKQVLTSDGINITHRKLYIADGTTIMTGGMNIADKYSLGSIHDTLMSYQGEAVKETLKQFFYDWKKAGGTFTTSMQNTFDKPLIPFDGKTFPLRMNITSPSENKTDIKKMMLAAIGSAKDNIKIAMPYFSDDDLVNKLIDAKKRGIKVTVLLPKINDEKVFDKLNIMTANQLIKWNVEVFWTGAKTNRFNHSKVLTVDNIWVTMGSCNADQRAFYTNQELNIAVSDLEFTVEVNKRFFDFHISNSEVGKYVNIPWFKKPLYSFLEGADKLF